MAARSRSVAGAASTDDHRGARARARAPRRAARRSRRRPGHRPRRRRGAARRPARRRPPRARRRPARRSPDRAAASRARSSSAAASAGSMAASSARMPAKAFSTSRPRVRERRNPASRLTCARRSASTSGSGRGSTAATSRPNACPPRSGSLSVMSTRSVKGRSSREAASGSRPPFAPSARAAGRGTPGRTTRRPAARARRRVDSTSSTKPSLASAPAMRLRSRRSGSATRNRSCPPRAALRSASSGPRGPSESGIEQAGLYQGEGRRGDLPRRPVGMISKPRPIRCAIGVSGVGPWEN